MRRRDFMILGGCAALSLPVRAHAQRPPALPVIGFLRSTTFSNAAHLVDAFRAGLKEAGFVEGENVAIEFRAAEGRADRLPALVAELVGRPADVIVGETRSAIVAKAATATIPIVFTTAGDPVRDGLVGSLNQPGGNVTGVTFQGALLGSKRLELIRQLLPRATLIAMLADPRTPEAKAERDEVQAAARTMGQDLVILDVATAADIENAFATLAERKAGALVIGAASFLSSSREQIVALAARHRLPTIYVQRDNVLAGGLMSYAASNIDAYREAGSYAGRILKGEKPADLPVMQTARFEFVINLGTARALGLAIPDRLLALADEAVE